MKKPVPLHPAALAAAACALALLSLTSAHADSGRSMPRNVPTAYTQECAACHTASYRTSPDANPVFVVGGPGHTLNIQNFFRLIKSILCQHDLIFGEETCQRWNTCNR